MASINCIFGYSYRFLLSPLLVATPPQFTIYSQTKSTKTQNYQIMVGVKL